MKAEEIIWVILFIGTLVLGVFAEMGFYIFILTAFTYWMTKRYGQLTMAITMLIVFIVFTIGMIVVRFKVEPIGIIMFFCSMTGYLLGGVKKQ